jgi:hypothetical protein
LTKSFASITLPMAVWAGTWAMLASLPALAQPAAVSSAISDSSAAANSKVLIAVRGGTPVTTGATASNSVPGPIVLPIEVFGPNNTIVSASFQITKQLPPQAPVQLWFKINGLEYETQASVKVNNSPWMAIDSATMTMSKNAIAFGGIGGGFDSFLLRVRLPLNAVATGLNTINFRFNRSNRVSSGFRVLAFNLQSGGENLLPPETFTNDDPSKWQPPLHDAADIAAGHELWETGDLIDSPGGVPIKAHCSDCHAYDGRDLKYFNYSNLSIQTRSMFHGMTALQGNQIASYIRSLKTPTSVYARPWNPPYQPGPGMDSRPVSDWAAGAGLDAVLDNDADTLSYLMPGGKPDKLAYNAYLNQREIPIVLQLPDWNHWLPTVHPKDAFGSQFTSSALFTGYALVRSELKPNDPETYRKYYQDISLRWLTHQNEFFAEVRQPPNSAAWHYARYGQDIYSVAQWMMVKSWEINQEYGLEGMGKVIYGPQSADRAWYTNQGFFTSPFMLKIPKPSPGIGNGSYMAYTYHTFMWYETQLILNDGNGMAIGTWPIDRGYTLAYLYNDIPWDYGTSQIRMGTAGLMMEWLTKILQTRNDPGDASPYFLVLSPGVVATWSDLPASQKEQIMTAWTKSWLDFVKTLKPQDLFTAPSGVTPQATTMFKALRPGSFTGDLAWALPRLRYEGVDPELLQQLAKWASGFWPAHDWNEDLSQGCVPSDRGGNLNCQ